MPEYKISRISEKEPKKYEGANGTIYYIRVMLEGHERPVAIGKKSPDALKVGDVVSGTIEPTEYESDKFKPEKKPFTPSAKTYGKSPEEQANIMKQTALKAAVEVVAAQIGGLESFSTVDEVVLNMAEKFNNWLQDNKESKEF